MHTNLLKNVAWKEKKGEIQQNICNGLFNGHVCIV